jgi:3'(2'), 5'-bisphosphate nucleotidase
VPRKAFSADELIPTLLDTAREAGALIMSHYRMGHAVARKDDASPVTEADRAADRLIVARLRQLAPSFPTVSEEGEKPDVAGVKHFWLVDPLDGTKSFIRGTGCFTVNIGLIEHGVPVLGIVYDPVADAMYWGTASGAFCAHRGGAATPICARAPQEGRQAAFISHSHLNRATEDYLVTRAIEERIPCASSIKFCFLAEGKADLYPRFGPTMEWDTAAGHAVLTAAGGRVVTPEGEPFLYGKAGFLNGNFVASGR